MFKPPLPVLALGLALLAGAGSVAAQGVPRDPALRPVFDGFGSKFGLIALVDDFMTS
jgi:hypothetical protein